MRGGIDSDSHDNGGARADMYHDRPLPGEAASVSGGTLNPTETQYHLFVERVRDYAVFLMDANGIITHWGEGAQRIKEFTPEEVIGQHLRKLYPPNGAEDGTADEHLRQAAEDGEYIGEGMRIARDRGLFPARVVLTSLWKDGQLFGFSKVTQDLTERRRVQEQLELALRAAEAASVEKSRFLATMSHEIRTPINAVLGYTDLLDLEIAGSLTPRQRTYLERIRISSRHLLSLLEDVLDFSRVEAGRLPVKPEQVRVAAVVDDALSLLRPQAGSRGLQLEVDCEPEIEFWGDPARVRQIVLNLVGNALKFTPAGGLIRIVGATAPSGAEADLPGDGPWTRIRVEDTGIGIPASKLETIFEPFVQVQDTLTREHQGTGLGLAISRRLARLQGGDVAAHARPEGGSVFSLWLPASERAATARDEERDGQATASLTAIGQSMSGASYAIARAVAHRLRVDPATRDLVRDLTRSELEDHMPTFLADVAQLLVVLGEDGADAGHIVQDGHDFQKLLAERHGRQRRRLGFTDNALRREYEILQDEVESMLRHAGCATGNGTASEPVSIVRRLLLRARDIAVNVHTEAASTTE